jgi:adenosylhomocysteine nucleosidase
VTAIGVFVATRWELAAVRQAFAASEMRVVGGIRCVVARQGQVEWWVIPMGVGPERATCDRQTGARGAVICCGVVDGVCLCLGSGRDRRGVDRHSGDDGGWTRGRAARSLCAGVRRLGAAGRAGTAPAGAVRPVRDGSTGPLSGGRETGDRRRAGGIGLDMESAALGFVASERKIHLSLFVRRRILSMKAFRLTSICFSGHLDG